MGSLCLQCSWETGYGEAQAAAEVGVVGSREGVRGGKAMKGEALLLLLQETEICSRRWFALLCSFQIPPGARRRRDQYLKRSLCWYAASVKVTDAAPGVLAASFLVFAHGNRNTTQRAAGPASPRH